MPISIERTVSSGSGAGESTQINAVCPHDCPDACSIQVEVRKRRAVSVAGHPQHPVTDGWLCAKVAPYLDHVYHQDRITTPLRRVGRKGSGEWREISWQQAIEEIADRWRRILGTDGGEAILPYSYSGTLGLVQMAVASARLWNRLGASRLQRSICMAATRAAVRATLGARMSPPYHHVEDSKLLVFWGHNPVSTAPHLMPFVRRAQRRGCRLVVIDPLKSRSGGNADLFLQPLPGTDAALALAVMREIFENNRHDSDWLGQNCLGWQALRERAKDYTVEKAARITGVASRDIRTFAQCYAQSSPAMIRMGDAVNRNLQGGQTVRAISCLPALTGQYGLRGGGLSCSTGDYFQWDDEAVNHWQDCPTPGRWINMNRIGAALCGEVDGPPIQSLFVFGANPMVSAPNTGAVQRGLLRDDLFTVVHDLFITDTARFADILLPATSQFEQVDLHRGYGHTLMAYNRPAIAPLGQAKSNWDVMRLLAESLGFTDRWLRQSADEVIEEILEATERSQSEWIPTNLSELKTSGFHAYADPGKIPFGDLRFPTDSGKIELFSKGFAREGLDPLPDWRDPYPDIDEQWLQLVSPAAHHFINTSLANQSNLRQREGEPEVILNPVDARARNLEQGDLVRIESEVGYCQRRLKISDRVRPSVALATQGYWQQGEVQQTVNWTTSDRLADIAGQSSFQSNPVKITPVTENSEQSS